MEKICLDKRAAARLLSVSIRTVESLIANKELPVCRIGRRVVISRESLIDFARRDHSTQGRRAR